MDSSCKESAEKEHRRRGRPRKGNRKILKDSNNLTRPTINEKSNLMQNCEELFDKILAKYHNYTKHQEILRLQLIGSNNDYTFLKTWMDIAHEETFTMQPKHSDLCRFYETLLKNNFVKEFFDYSKDQEILQLKSIPTLTLHNDLKKNIDAAEDSITSLKSDYDKKEHEETRRSLLNETINEFERLNKCLDKVYEYMMVVFSEHNDLIRRYKLLLQKPTVDDFINCAKHEERLQPKFDEKAIKYECSETCLVQSNEEIESLNSKISEARKMLNDVRQRRELVEKQHKSFDHLSEQLCILLSKYQPSILSDKMKETRRPIDESIQSSVNNDGGNSNTVDEIVSEITISESMIDDKDIKDINPSSDVEPTSIKNDKEPIEVKDEKVDDLSATLSEKVPESLTPNVDGDKSSAKNFDELPECSHLKRPFTCSSSNIDQDGCELIVEKKSKK